jgi:CubicO group peptidase (beta-lactamase class C family)
MHKKIFWFGILLIGLSIFLTACGSVSTDIPVIDPTNQNKPVIPTPEANIVSGTLGQQLDDYFTEDTPLFSGGVLIARQGEILLSKGYNYADWELRVPNSPHTKFRITSITKPFTATLIMMLHERGLIDLDEKVCSYLPDCPDSWGEITVHQLLTHTSGIPEYTRLPDARAEARQPHNVSGLLDLFKEEPLESSPGETFQYSNSNYIVLGAVVERISGETFEGFLKGVVLDPLEMENTGLDNNIQILRERAAGYQIQGRALVNAPYLDMTNAYSTAGMYSTVEDLYKWDQALYSDLLLSQESIEMMYSPELGRDARDKYGYGWRIGDLKGGRKIWHAGLINGFHTYLGRYIDDRTTIIILSNIETEDIDSIVEDLEDLIFTES